MSDAPGRLGRVLDRFEIADLSAAYCRHIDDYAMDRLSPLFTEDCIFDAGPGNGGPRQGNDFSPMAERHKGFRRTQHQLGQNEITFTGDDSATGLVYATAWHQRWDMTTLTVRLRYVDKYQRRDGRWLIHYRQLVAIGLDEGIEDVWNWSSRNRPEGCPE